MSAFRRFPALLLAALTACREAPPAAPALPAELVETDLLAELEAGSEPLRTERFLGGRAFVHVGATGTGRIVVTATLDRSAPETIFEAELSGERVSEAAPLPGAGFRAVSIAVEISGDADLLSLRLLESPAPALPESGPLAGSLAGRSVALFLFDSLHSAHLSAYGYERDTSPFMKRIAADGVRFETAYSQTSWTLSSVSSLFTSVEQERHGVLEMDQRLGDDFTTLAELFKARGYRTVATVQNGVIWPQTGLDRGFDEYKIFPWDVEGTRRLLARAVEAMLEESEAPLFLYVHLTPPHQPYQPPAPFRDRYVDPGYEGWVTGEIIDCAKIHKEQPAPEDPDVKQLEALYDAHIRYVDDELGQTLGKLVAAGRHEEFLFLLTSDHGEAFLQHGAQGHNSNVYEEMVRVPLVAFAPGGPLPTAVVEAPVSLLDVAPTLVELVGLDAPRHGARGTSLVELMERPHAALRSARASLVPRPLFFTSRYRNDLKKLFAAVRLGRFKLVSKDGATQLYDLALDPGETLDLSQELPLTARILKRELSRWYADATSTGAKAATTEIDAARQAEIEGLGYTGEDEDEEKKDG